MIDTDTLETLKGTYEKGVIDLWREYLQDPERNEDTKIVIQDKMREVCTNNVRGRGYAKFGIISGKNTFALLPVLGRKKDELLLAVYEGLFRTQDSYKISEKINISDVLDRKGDDQFAELMDFLDMNHREVMERFGISIVGEERMANVANLLLVDSLLKDRYSDLESWEGLNSNNNDISIQLSDGTNIVLKRNMGRIEIEKDGKSAQVSFDTVNKGKKKMMLSDIKFLDVANVEYDGNLELVQQLKQAMAEQFESQREVEEPMKAVQSSEMNNEVKSVPEEEREKTFQELIDDILREEEATRKKEPTFAELLDEMFRDEEERSSEKENEALISEIISRGVKESDVQGLKEDLVRRRENIQDKDSIEEQDK